MAPNRASHQKPVMPEIAKKEPFHPSKADDLQVAAFVNHYRQHFNATAAARQSGYARSVASAAGWRLLHDGRVQELLAKAALDVMALTDIRVSDILRALNEIAQLDPGECFGQWLNPKTKVLTVYLKDLHDMPIHVRRAISSMKVTKKNLTSGDGFVDTIIEVKFWNKVEACRLLAEHKGALTPKVDEIISERRLETMSDEELQAQQRQATAKWDRHVEARKKARLALVGKK